MLVFTPYGVVVLERLPGRVAMRFATMDTAHDVRMYAAGADLLSADAPVTMTVGRPFPWALHMPLAVAMTVLSMMVHDMHTGTDLADALAQAEPVDAPYLLLVQRVLAMLQTEPG